MPIQDQVGRGDDDQVRRIRALEQGHQAILALAGSAKAIAAAVQTGLGNLASSGTTWQGPVSSPSTVSASGNVSAGSQLSGSTLQVSGAVKLPAVFSTPISTNFRVVYNGNGDGSMGFNLSSRRFKQDIADCTLDPVLLAQLRIVTFRYIAAVEQLGDKAAIEVGLIAEEVDALGFKWMVDYDENGLPEGLKFDRLAVAALALAQDVDERLSRLEAKVN